MTRIRSLARTPARTGSSSGRFVRWPSRSRWSSTTAAGCRWTHLHQGVFVVTLPERRCRTTRSPPPTPTPWTGGPEDSVLDDPYRYLPMLGEYDLYLIGEGRHEELWRVLGAHVREVGHDQRDLVRGLGAERARCPGHRRFQLLGRPGLPDALAGQLGRVGAVRPGRGRRRQVQVRGLRPRRGVAGKGRPAGQRRRAAARHRVGGVHLEVRLGGRGVAHDRAGRGRRYASR